MNELYEIIDSSIRILESHKHWITYMVSVSLGGLIYFGIRPLQVKEDSTTSEYISSLIRRFLLVTLLLIVPLIFVYIYLLSIKLSGNSDYFNDYLNQSIYGFKGAWAFYLSIISGVLTFKVLKQRLINPYISNLMRTHRVRQTNEKMSDIRHEILETQSKTFDPIPYFKEGSIFLGLDEHNQPLYESDELFKTRNLKIIGPSQTGKGVAQGVLLYQSILKGWCTGFIDIKPDDFIYSIMCKACKDAGRPPPIVVDLTGVGPGSYNMFANGSHRDIQTRLQYALSLNDSGSNADFYRVNERKVIYEIMQYFDGSLDTFEKLLKGIMPDGSIKESYYDITTKSQAYVRELKSHKPLNPRKGRGFNVDATLKNGAVFYIRGSITDKLIRNATTVLIMDLIQSSIRMGKQKSHCYLAIDEVKFIVSDVLSTGLSVLLSKGVNISIAYQTLDNLLNLEDKTLNAKAIKSELEVNSLTTLTYRAGDEETAEWASKLTGTRNKTIARSEEVNYSHMGAEAYTGRKQIHQDQEELISMNKMKALPPRVAALIRPNELSKIIYTCWIPLKKEEMMEVKKPSQQEKIAPIKKTESGNEDSLEQFMSDVGVKNVL